MPPWPCGWWRFLGSPGCRTTLGITYVTAPFTFEGSWNVRVPPSWLPSSFFLGALLLSSPSPSLGWVAAFFRASSDGWKSAESPEVVTYYYHGDSTTSLFLSSSSYFLPLSLGAPCSLLFTRSLA